MPRSKRRRRPTTSPTPTATAGWRWRTFPVFFAFVCGLFVMGLLATSPVGFGAFYIAVFGVAFGAAHIVTRRIAERRMLRRASGTAPPPEEEPRPQEQRRLAQGARPGAPRRR